MTDFESEFLTRWQQLAPTAPLPQSEFRFVETRRFRFDFAWIDSKVAVECQGGVFRQGRHSRGAGQESDYTKHNNAVALGWRVFYFTHGMLRRDPIGCIDLVRNAVEPLPETTVGESFSVERRGE